MKASSYGGTIAISVLCAAIVSALITLMVVSVARQGSSGHEAPITRFQTGVNDSVCTICPNGPRGPSGPSGGTGPEGPRGGQGDPGMCLANPLCGVGPRGFNGTQGPTGARGLQGLDGPRGADGPQGPQGIQGIQGMQGIQGIIGLTGLQGVPGICDCNSSSLALGNTTVDLELRLQNGANLTCAPGSFVDQSCLGGACADRSGCDTVERSLHVTDNSNPLGAALSAAAGAMVEFGKELVSRLLITFDVFATTVRIVADGDGKLQSNGNLNIMTTSPSSTLVIDSGGSMSIDASGSGVMSLSTVAGAMMLKATSANMKLEAGNVMTLNTLSGGSLQLEGDNIWWKTSDTLGDWLKTSPPGQVANVQDWLGPVLSLSFGSAINIYKTLQFISTGSHIVTASNDGFIHLGPYLAVGGGTIIAGNNNVFGSTLQLQRDTATDTLDVRATISNGQGSLPVTISDPHGVSMSNGAGVTMVLGAASTVLTAGTTTVTVSATGVDIVGNVNVTGDIFASGMISATGSCCVSDKRAKLEGEPMDVTASLKRIASIPLRTFTYLPEFVAANPGTPSSLQRGVWAQDVAQLIPQAVVTLPERKVGEAVYKDFMLLNKAEMVPDLIGAIQALLTRVSELEARLAAQ